MPFRKSFINFLLALGFVLFISFPAFAQGKRIALTFDDAPDSLYTPKVLKILKANKVHATFFLIGSLADHNRDMVLRIYREGHCLGNHSYHHLDFWNVTGNYLLTEEIGRTAGIIHEITGMMPRLYRPPYGDIPDSLRSYLQSQGFRVALWDIDPNDWDLKNTPDDIIGKVLRQARDSTVVLLHCGNGDRSHTIKALPKIIKGLKEKGFELVRLDDLLGIPESIYEVPGKE